MSKDWKETAVHAMHAALHTQTGKEATKAVAVTVATAATAVLGPAVAGVALPLVAVGAIGYGLWSLLSD